MRRTVVLIVLATALTPGARGQTLGKPTTVPPGVLEMAPSDQTGLVAGLILRAVKNMPAEDRAAGTVLDWYPAPGGFRVTGGFRDADDSGPRSGFAPYLGFGWQGAVMGDSVLVGLDFGALYRGRPDVRVVETEASDADEKNDQKRLPPISLPFEPVFSITLTYRF